MDGQARWFTFGNQSDDKHYVGVYLNDPTARQNYQAMGYRAELYGPEGVVPFGGRTGDERDGMEVVKRGHLLMSISMDRKREIEEHGEDGTTGLEMIRQHEAQILEHKHGDLDPVRGQHGRNLIEFENETSALREEMGA